VKTNFLEQQQDKPFSISMIVYSTVRKKWEKIKKKINLIIEKDPSKSEDGEKVIKQTEEIFSKFDDAVKKCVEAAKNAKSEYDQLKNQKIGSADKVLDFFGFTAKQKDLENKKIFIFDPAQKTFRLKKQSDRNFKLYTIKQISSFDIDIIPFLDDPNPTKARQMVLKLLTYRDFLEDKKTVAFDEKGLQDLENEAKEFDPAEIFNLNNFQFNVQESKLSEEEENQQDKAELVRKKIVKMAEERFKRYVKVFVDKNRNRNFKVNLIKQYAQEPSIVVFYKFGDNSELMEKDPFLATLETIELDYNESKITSYLIEILKDSKIKFDTSDVSDIVKKKDFSAFSKLITGSEGQSPNQESNDELEKLRQFFEEKVEEKVKELKKGIPLFNNSEGEMKIDPVYNETNSIVKEWLLSGDTAENAIKFLKLWFSNNKEGAYQIYDNTLKKKEDFEAVLQDFNTLIEKRNEEAKRDLKALAIYMEKNSTDKIGGYGFKPKYPKRIFNTLKRDTDAVLKLYKIWYDVMKTKKKDLLKYFQGEESSSGEAESDVESSEEKNSSLKQKAIDTATRYIKNMDLQAFLLITDDQAKVYYPDKDPQNLNQEDESRLKEYAAARGGNLIRFYDKKGVPQDDDITGESLEDLTRKVMELNYQKIRKDSGIEEKLLKLIKPLIREKLKRKQNGKKNLRN